MSEIEKCKKSDESFFVVILFLQCPLHGERL